MPLPFSSQFLYAPLAGTTVAQAFQALMIGSAALSALVHGTFIVLFWLSGVPLLAWFNVGSVLLHLTCFALFMQRRMLAGALLMSAEVSVHAALAVALVGWDSGFHYYFMLLVPVALLSTEPRAWIKWAFAMAGVLGYVALDALWRHAVPPYTLHPTVLNGLHYFNVVAILLMVATLTHAYYRLVSGSERCLRELATTDPLTRLLNRRALRERIVQEDRRQQREHRPLSFVLIDVDHFKSINDRHGHEIGDQVLVQVAQVLSRGVREVDHLARWGGEEFLVVLPETDEAMAAQVAERLRLALAGVRLSGEPHATVTATLGVVQRDESESPDHAICRADQALYAGKRAGRNQVVRASMLTAPATAAPPGLAPVRP